MADPVVRVVAGKHRGRALIAPEGRWLRPTADRVRESIFNVLTHGDETPLSGARILDAFCGTGAMGIEALSRGAAEATFIDTDKRAIDVCRRNLHALGEEQNATLLKANCLDPPHAAQPCTLVFLDPPYREGLAAPALAALAAAGWIEDGASCVVELGARDTFLPPDDRFAIVDERRYGAAWIVFLRAALPPAE